MSVKVLDVAIAAVLLTGCMFCVVPASAEPFTPDYTDAERAYEQDTAGWLCMAISDDPTVSGVATVVGVVVNAGWTGYDAGQIVSSAIAHQCPEFTQLGQEYARLNIAGQA